MTLIVEARHRFGQFELDAAFTSARGITALFGRSGSGKTSLIRIIAGLTRATAGRVVIDGDVLADSQARVFVPMHRRRFGCVFQEARLFPHLTVRQNLGYGRWFAPRSERGDDVERITDLLGLEPLLQRSPATLSGGEKQRVAIGRALLSAPRLLLMDEPLAALDEARKAEILPYIERLRDELDMPVVYVSHSVAEVARLADRIVVIDAGKVQAIGSAMEVFNQPSISLAAGRRDAGALLEGVVAAVDGGRRLTTIALAGATLVVPGYEGRIGAPVRVHIPARDVMLATVRPESISALNVVAGTVAGISTGEDGMMDVRVDCDGSAIQSRITELSCERLQLAVGIPVFAIIKTVALDRS